MYKVSHLARAHGQAIKDQSRMSLVLLSNHEILLRNTNTIEIGLEDKIQKLQNKAARLSLFLFTRYTQMFFWMSLVRKDLKLLG